MRILPLALDAPPPTLQLIGICLALFATFGCGPTEKVRSTPTTGPVTFDAPAGDASAAPPAPVIPEDAPTVVFLGDSIGAGLHLAEHQAVPAILQRRLAQRDLPFHLVNASESGRTSAGGVTAIDWVLRSEPDLVVIELGGNDGLRGVDPQTTRANLATIIERSRAKGARVLLLGIRLPTNYGDLAERYDELYPELASEFGLALIPYWMKDVGAVPELNLADGLHPNAEGHERLADNVQEALTEVLRGFKGE